MSLRGNFLQRNFVSRESSACFVMCRITRSQNLYLGPDGQEQLEPKKVLCRVEPQVPEPRYTRVGRGEVVVVCGANGDDRHRLETFLARRKGRTARPKVQLRWGEKQKRTDAK